ncbi:expressed unknown protein [Seminavis robusta]|uniref:Uncharacterized protein n=1 Tax=Seminavis robusta TaxID=568900 RepID=A0A9N8EE49_9STRA|nr:expressed unknown protein [Seminavis robusta]|eukprot:Sro1047_g235130.1 n/a (452) ;mRNA; r:15289-16644
MVQVAAPVFDEISYLVDGIQEAARNVNGFSEESAILASRCKKLSAFVLRLKSTPSGNNFTGYLEKLAEAFEAAEAFLCDQEFQTIYHQNTVSKVKNFKRSFDAIHNGITRAANSLVLAVNTELPLHEGDDPADPDIDKSDRTKLFPPSIEETAPSKDSIRMIPFFMLHFEDPADPSAFVDLDFSKVPPAENPFWMESSASCTASSASRKDRKAYYERLIAVRAIDQAARVTEIRVVLANLDPGDTTFPVHAAKTVLTVSGVVTGGIVGAINGLVSMVKTGSVSKGFDSAKQTATSAVSVCRNSFLHWLMEIDLQDGSTCTLERCADDVYLYEGKSSRQNQHCVFKIPVNNSFAEYSMRQLIRFRNKQRKVPYNLHGNNCVHFVFNFVDCVAPGIVKLQQEGGLEQSQRWLEPRRRNQFRLWAQHLYLCSRTETLGRGSNVPFLGFISPETL